MKQTTSAGFAHSQKKKQTCREKGSAPFFL